ncbi:flagellar hook-basal body protein [Sphingomonas sp.]|uniref:flagellar hook-basal body protein n=1 Tax=Sphingomonas sp. TaxID=28214 RepID=UPI0025FBF7CA|nr:flagellar hook-basal body protein [Sphingomonas sp.]
MADLIESARAILSVSERRMEATANNVANLTTPGFKSQKLYSDAVSEASTLAPSTVEKSRVDLTQGKLSKTGNPYDLAIGGAGFFRLAGANGNIVYSRQGQFHRDGDGRLVNAQGMAVQGADGDIVLPFANAQILGDGTVLQDGAAVGRIALFQPGDGVETRALGGSFFALSDAEEVKEVQLHQGMVETSNVALADEMVAMMEAMRNAEGGAKLVQTYDDLIGRAITTFGQR